MQAQTHKSLPLLCLSTSSMMSGGQIVMQADQFSPVSTKAQFSGP